MDIANDLKAERDAIKARLDGASEAEKKTLLKQFGERLAHLEARIAKLPPGASAPPPAKS